MVYQKILRKKRKWDSQRWNVSSGRAVGSKEDARELNNLLDVICSKVYQAKKPIIDLYQVPTAENVNYQETRKPSAMHSR